MSHFRLLSSAEAYNTIPVRKYVSLRTGLTVVIADVEGVYVEGTFLVVTEPEDDYGFPHALEHLIFDGSNKYPYKGILTYLAKEATASSDTEHTNYNFTVVGQDAALALLPVYADHILWPLLSEEGFTSNVYHITGDGDDGGLVYDERKDGESYASYKRCETRLMSEMYAGCGLAYDYAGKPEFIRKINNTMLKQFHARFYRPENISLILNGQLDHEAVFNALSKVEDDLVATWISEPLPSYEKPWQKVAKPNYGDFTEYCPADSEENGDILIGWRGPSSSKDMKACEFILEYLCDKSNGPLKKRLVDSKDPLAGIVSSYVNEHTSSTLRIDIFDTPLKKLQTAKDEVTAFITSIYNGEIVLDIEEINKLVNGNLLETRTCLEMNHHFELLRLCLADVRRSEKDDDFASIMNPQKYLKELLEEPADYWLDLFKKYFSIDMVIVFGIPSIELKIKLVEEEKNRIQEQKFKFGEEGLAEKAKQLKKAKEFQQRTLPPGILDLIPLPSDVPRLFNSSVWSSDSEPCPHFDLKDLPIYARVQNLKTAFVHIHIILDTTAVDQTTRKWIPILLASIGECSVKHANTIIPRDEILSKKRKIIQTDTKEIGFKEGGLRSLANFVHLGFEILPEDYEKTVNLIHDILYNAEITSAELLEIVQKMQISKENSLNPQQILQDNVRDRLYSKESNAYWSLEHIQSPFLKDIVEKLNNNDEQVIEEAKTAYGNITQRLWLHLAADFEKCNLSSEVWSCFGKKEPSIQQIELPYLYWDAELMSNWGGGVIVAVEGIDRPSLTLLSPGPIGHAPQDAGPLLLATLYFSQNWLNCLRCELDFFPSPNESCLILYLYEVEDAAVAYGKLKMILNSYLADHNANEENFKLAKKIALYRILNCKTPKDVVKSTILNYKQRVVETYMRDLVKAIFESTPESIHAVAARWFPSMLDTSKTKMAVLCLPEKVHEVQAAFNVLGAHLEAYESDRH